MKVLLYHFITPSMIICLAFPAVCETPDELAEKAILANPKLKSLQLHAEALNAHARSVRAWKDPVLAIEYSSFPVDSWAMGDSMMTGIQLKLLQTVPFPGKNDRRERTAVAKAKIAFIEKDQAEVLLRASVKRGLLSLDLIRRLKELTIHQLSLIEQLRQRVRLRYETGHGDQKDLLKLSVLHMKLEDELGEYVLKDAELTASINGALHRDPRTSIKTHAYEQENTKLLDANHLQSLAEKHSPALKIIEQSNLASNLAAEQAQWERRPDFSVWIGYRFRTKAGMDDGTDFISVGASIPLPFDYTDSTESKKNMHLSFAAASEDARRAALDDIATKVEQILASQRRALGKVKTYKEQLVPEARKSLDAALKAYETGRGDFESIYQAEIDLITFERTMLISKTEYSILFVELEALIGIPLKDGKKPLKGGS